MEIGKVIKQARLNKKITQEQLAEKLDRFKKMGESKEVANAVYFLGNEENTYITGQVLNVDGGMIM